MKLGLLLRLSLSKLYSLYKYIKILVMVGHGDHKDEGGDSVGNEVFTVY